MNHFQSLPCELILKILTNIGLDDKFRMAGTCRILRYISRDPVLYKQVTIPTLSPASLIKLLKALSTLQLNLTSVYINDTDPKLVKTRSSPAAFDYLGLIAGDDYISNNSADKNNSETDSITVLNSVISFLSSSDTNGLQCLVVYLALWSGCQTDRILEGLKKFGGGLKHLKLPTQGQLFSDAFINLTAETPNIERVSGVLWTPTQRAVTSIARNWKNLRILEIADDHAGYDLSSALGMVFCHCRQLEVVRIYQVVPDEVGWKRIAKMMDEFTGPILKPLTTIKRTRSYIAFADDEEDVDYQDLDDSDVDEEGDWAMKDSCSSSPPHSIRTSSCTKAIPIAADRVRYLELSVICYCRSAPRILNTETCRVLQRIFPGIKSFRYRYEGARRGADVETTKTNLYELCRKWVGKSGVVDIVC